MRLFLVLLFCSRLQALGSGMNPNVHFQPQLNYKEKAETGLFIQLLKPAAPYSRFNNPFMSRARFRINGWEGLRQVSLQLNQRSVTTNERGQYIAMPYPEDTAKLRWSDTQLDVPIPKGQKLLILMLRQPSPKPPLPSIQSMQIETRGLAQPAFKTMVQTLEKCAEQLRAALEETDNFQRFLDPDYSDAGGTYQDFADYLMFVRKDFSHLRIQNLHLQKQKKRLILHLTIEAQRSSELPKLYQYRLNLNSRMQLLDIQKLN